MSGSLSSNVSSSVSGFLNSIGICGEASDATIAAQLAYLGIDHLRTDIASAPDLLAAGADGAKLDVIIPWYMEAITSSTVASTISTDIDPAASVVEAVEGPNEVNNDPDTFNGLSGAAGIEAEQQEIYALVKSDPALNNATNTTSVYNFSVLQGTPAGTYSGMQNYADYNNVHAYGGPGIPPSWILPYETTANTIAGSQPVVVTETGATTIPGSEGVDDVTQARFDLKALLDSYKLGVARTYLYNVQDWATGSAVGDFSAYYGLYNTDGSIKPAGTAMHNFTTILSQGEGTATSGNSSLSYSLTGLPYYGQSELFSKAAGVFDLVLWNETTDWNATTNTEIAVPASNVTLTLASTYGTISVYDPLTSTAPIATASNTNTITVALSDDPLIVEVTPPPAIDTMTFQVSEDAFAKTDAQFILTVDGNQVGGTQTVNAMHSTGTTELITVSGAWGAGQHAVGLSFINPQGTNRKLYVTGADYNGSAVSGASMTLTSNAAQTYTVGAPAVGTPAVGTATTAIATPAEDTITVHVSEDAWMGNAEFILLVDGHAVTTPTSVTTLHSSGQFQSFGFELNLATGNHTVGVQFMNDDYGGSPSKDRNLYVGGIDVDGQHYGTGTTPLYWNGTANYAITK